MSDTSYGFGETFENTSMDQMVVRVKAALKTEGFGVLFELPVHQKVKGAIGKDLRPYLILGACNPHLAYRAVQVEADIGLLLPCNVLLQQMSDDTVKVSFIDASRMLNFVGNDNMAEIGSEADDALRRAFTLI